MKYPAYPKYKPSGVEWLGEVPEHWEVKRLKFLANRSDQKVEADEDYSLPYVGLEHIESWTGKLLTLDAELVPSGISNRFRRGDTLFGKLRPYLAKACNPGFDGLCSTELLVLEPRGHERNYLVYQLLSEGFVSMVDSSTYGAKMPRANWEFIGSCLLPSPPPPEQRAIADFLDRETVKLDTLVAKKRELIEKLKEKRTALISRTVTRGLPPEAARAAGFNPQPKLKPSGIEWLGEVPEHWEVKRGRFCMKVNPRSDRLQQLEPEDEISFVPMEAVGEYGGLNLEMTKPIGEIGTSYTEFEEGDVIVAKITPCFENGKGAIANGLTNGVALGTTELHVLRVLFGLDRRFLFYLTISSVYRKTGEAEMYGAGGQKRVPPEFSRNFRVTLPPQIEQRAIADYLDRETAKIDQMSAKVEEAIARLQEYRTALITAAVTGKIDVREYKDAEGVPHQSRG
ncbi:hypothetical protein DCC62_27645 [candidate division KSB1 bacterium]|nr:MAG: hypothetical protein DCC62_27645 [candidate division KSB1 bacterium]